MFQFMAYWQDTVFGVCVCVFWIRSCREACSHSEDRAEACSDMSSINRHDCASFQEAYETGVEPEGVCHLNRYTLQTLQ